jgi:lipoprotein-anchoring transpeptidase ErfK/SrfK
VIGKYSVATAKEGSYTPEGKFTVVSKLINPSWGGGGYADPIVGGAPNNPLGKYWLGLSIGNGDIYGIHGTNNESSIGKYVTHGCIRMHNYELDSLFYTVDIGTNVWIGTESDLLSLME